ncbi:hypothetical protein BC2230_90178 [Burkholderia cepacia]
MQQVGARAAHRDKPARERRRSWPVRAGLARVRHEFKRARGLSRDRFCQSVKNRPKGVTTSRLQSALSPRLWIVYRVNRGALDSDNGSGYEADVKWTGTR